jgi:hypothetical protein
VTHNSYLLRLIATAVALGAAPTIAAAQSSPQTPVNQGGPMVIEQVQQGFAVAPEFKISRFDGSSAQFVGAHGGLLVGNGLLIGGGIYTLTNGSRGRGMTYGGAVVGWQAWSDRLLGLSVRGLIGLGQGTSTQTISLIDRNGRGVVREIRGFSSDFFVAEPQADLVVRLTKHLHLEIGGGYRLANASRANNDRFSGASGSIALRIGAPRL